MGVSTPAPLSLSPPPTLRFTHLGSSLLVPAGGDEAGLQFLLVPVAQILQYGRCSDHQRGGLHLDTETQGGSAKVNKGQRP